MNVTQFRKNISTELDKVLQGEVVTIERGGIKFIVIEAPRKSTAMTTAERRNTLEQQ